MSETHGFECDPRTANPLNEAKLNGEQNDGLQRLFKRHAPHQITRLRLLVAVSSQYEALLVPN